MAAVVLDRSDIALYSGDLRVVIPHLISAAPARKRAGTTVRFVGDAYPTGFRGEARGWTFDLTARFASYEQDQAVRLLELFETAAGRADSRLWFRTAWGQAPGVDFSGAVQVFEYNPAPQIGLYIDVSFTAVAVAYSEAV